MIPWWWCLIALVAGVIVSWITLAFVRIDDDDRGE